MCVFPYRFAVVISSREIQKTVFFAKNRASSLWFVVSGFSWALQQGCWFLACSLLFLFYQRSTVWQCLCVCECEYLCLAVKVWLSCDVRVNAPTVWVQTDIRSCGREWTLNAQSRSHTYILQKQKRERMLRMCGFGVVYMLWRVSFVLFTGSVLKPFPLYCRSIESTSLYLEI